MDSPKISVLIPMYNRKHYIQDCVNSVLNQTFQDFEIIIRDDGSTDGSAEFVEEKYKKEISVGKIKLSRNEKNLGEGMTVIRLVRETTGKYFKIFHSDDVLMPYALEHLNDVAEATNADVVHSVGRFNTPESGIITQKNLSPHIHDANPVNKVTIMPADQKARFIEWASNGTFVDLQYNLFRRKFVAENELFLYPAPDMMGLCRLFWIFKAKVYVKTPVIYYIYRNSPDSISRTSKKKPHNETVESFVNWMFNINRSLDQVLNRIDLFKNNSELKNFVKLKFLTDYDSFVISRLGIYDNGITSDVWNAGENGFKKFMGDDSAFYPAVLFHWIQCIKAGKNFHQIMFENALNSLSEVQKINVAPPPPLAVAA